MGCILCIISYIFISFIFINFEKKYNNQKNKKWSIILVFTLAIMCVILNLFVTKYQIKIDNGNYNYDRNNYLVEFMGYRNTSLGLTFIFNLVKLFSNNIEFVFYITTFVSCLLLFFAYEKEENKNIFSSIFFLLTDFVFCTFYALKQCYTCAFASLLFVILLHKKFKFRDLLCILLIVLSCLFHTSGVILIPIYILFRLSEILKIKLNPYFICGALLLLLLFLDPLLEFIYFAANHIYPDIAERIIRYFNEGVVFNKINSVFVKGFPYYIVAIYSILKYDSLKDKVLNYDKYCALSIFGAFFYFLSAISYWMFRFTWLFYLPMAILFGILLKEEKNKFIKISIMIVVYGSMAFILLRWIILMFINFNGF